jgi:uncharacterized membrane protein
MSDQNDTSHGRLSWFERPGNARLITIGLIAVCAVLVGIDILIHKHGPFKLEHTYAFYAWFSLAVCVALVLVANVVRRILMRSEDYYDR